MSFQQSASEWHGADVDVGAPKAYDREDGRIVELDTDGSGKVVASDCGPAPKSAWGLPRGTTAELREELHRLKVEKENASPSYSDMKREVLRMLRKHGPASTKDAIADHARVWVCQAGSALHDLSRKGLAECYPHPAAGERKYLWRNPE